MEWSATQVQEQNMAYFMKASRSSPTAVATTLTAAMMALAACSCANAQSAWPSREVRLIVPFAAGSGGTDAIARLLAEKLRDMWGQPVVMENIPGSSGTIGVAKLARSAPDGYTLVLSGDAAIVVAVNMYKRLAYDPVKDLAPIIQIGRTSNILVVNAALGPASLTGLVAQAKAKPHTITFNSTGIGTSQHMGFEQLKKMAAIDILHVPSRGPTMPDLLGGHVTASFANILVALPQVKEGKLRALAVSGPKRAPTAPDIPTVAEQGYPGFDATAWYGILAPTGTPDPIIRKVNRDVAQALAEPAFRAKLTQLGLELEDKSTSDDFAAFIKREILRVGEIVTSAGIKID
jgi:tripartite-type tricarboxylate transporter receptor subunit TctC